MRKRVVVAVRRLLVKWAVRAACGRVLFRVECDKWQRQGRLLVAVAVTLACGTGLARVEGIGVREYGLYGTGALQEELFITVPPGAVRHIEPSAYSVHV